MSLRVLIADDEAAARQAMRRALADLEGVEVVGEACSGTEALSLVGELEPDVVFLDIRMPGMSGLEVSAELRERASLAIVFVTAYDQYAVEAFEHAAIDYVLKPVEPQRVAESVRRIRAQAAPSIASVLSPVLEHLREPESKAALLRVGGGLRRIEASDVRYLESAGNYVRIHMHESDCLARGTITDVAERFGGGIVRVHRSYAVQRSEIAEVRRPDGNDPMAYLKNGDAIPIGRTYWPELSRQLGG